jgi:ribosomal protein S18 acetylase RimI-like enzyme
VVTADVSARLAWADDARPIARVQVAAWRELYNELLTPEQLDSLDVDAFAERWEASLTKPPDARMRVLVALERTEVRGFVLVRPCLDPDADQVADGEIGEFVVDPAHRGEGHGSRLLQAAMDTLAADKFTRVRWWVASTDDALREFVTSSGWEADGAHRELEDEAGHKVKQVRLHTAIPA